MWVDSGKVRFKSVQLFFLVLEEDKVFLDSVVGVVVVAGENCCGMESWSRAEGSLILCTSLTTH